MIIPYIRAGISVVDFLFDTKRFAREAGYNFAAPIRHEFNWAMDYLFDEKLYPFANNIDYMAQRLIHKSEEAAKEIIKEGTDQLTNLIEETLTRAEEMSCQFTPQAFREELIKPTLVEIAILESSFFQDATQLIDRVEEVIAGEVEKFRNDLKHLRHILPNPLDACRRQLKIEWKAGVDLSDIELYRLMECYELRKLNEHTPVEQILDTYGQLQHNAALMRFVSKNAPAFQDIFIRDWLKYGQLYKFWSQFR